MTGFHDISEAWLAWIVAASWQLAVVVCLVGLLAAILPGTAPRIRHGLWLLVLIKVFLPPQLTAPWSVGRLAIAPLAAALGLPTVDSLGPWHMDTTSSGSAAEAPGRLPSADALDTLFAPPALLVIWAAGCLVVWGVVAWRYVALVRLIRSAAAIDEGPARVLLERIALDLRINCVPDLFATDRVTSPFLFGLLRPTIVMPQSFLAEPGNVELRAVLMHELVHVKRMDAWIGWLQVLAQGLFWFHPLVWWANSQLRQARECACDQAVLGLSTLEPQSYGESIVRVLAASRGRSLAGGSLVGVFERGAHLQERLENIMNYTPHRESEWVLRLTLAAAALVLLPMSPGHPQNAGAQTASAEVPRIVKTVPKVGATDVDPALTEIVVTFDRDMGAGMSWTGGPPEFPPLDQSREAAWKDARTCVLPVKLSRGTYYRVGINSKSHQNFKSKEGVAARPSATYFTTQGATDEVEAQAGIPEVASLHPENGASDVDPKTTQLRVTFNMKMGKGMSWTGGGPKFPKIPEGKRPSWTADGLTCTLPVALEPGHEYELGLNGPSHKNFQSAAGVPLGPVVYRFRTANPK